MRSSINPQVYTENLCNNNNENNNNKATCIPQYLVYRISGGWAGLLCRWPDRIKHSFLSGIRH